MKKTRDKKNNKVGPSLGPTNKDDQPMPPVEALVGKAIPAAAGFPAAAVASDQIRVDGDGRPQDSAGENPADNEEGRRKVRRVVASPALGPSSKVRPLSPPPTPFADAVSLVCLRFVVC